MYCSYCGTEVEENDKFCKNCGKSLEVSELTETVQSEEVQSVAVQSEEAQSVAVQSEEAQSVTEQSEEARLEPAQERVVWKPQPAAEGTEGRQKKTTRRMVAAVVVGGLVVFLIVSSVFVTSYMKAGRAVRQWEKSYDTPSYDLPEDDTANSGDDWDTEDDRYWDEDESAENWEYAPGEDGAQGNLF